MFYGAALVLCRLLGVGMFGIPVVNGYTSTIVAILFLGGVQLMSVGILGEYIGRVYDEVKRRPLFLVFGEREADPALWAFDPFPGGKARRNLETPLAGRTGKQLRHHESPLIGTRRTME